MTIWFLITFENKINYPRQRCRRVFVAPRRPSVTEFGRQGLSIFRWLCRGSQSVRDREQYRIEQPQIISRLTVRRLCEGNLLNRRPVHIGWITIFLFFFYHTIKKKCSHAKYVVRILYEYCFRLLLLILFYDQERLNIN